MGMHTDKLHRKVRDWRGMDASRAEEVGEQRAEIKEFLELTGWNKTALAWTRKLDKLDQDKRDDILRSFDDLRTEMQTVWDGASTPDMFGHNSKEGEPEQEPVDFHQDAPATDDEMVDFRPGFGDETDADGNVIRMGTR